MNAETHPAVSPALGHVEFIGLPGSGKSVLAQRLIRMLRGQNLRALDFDAALVLGLARAARQAGGWKSRGKALLLRTAFRRLGRGAFWPREQVLAGCAFGADHPALLASLARILAASGKHPAERNRILQYLFREFAGFQLFAAHRQAREILVWEEGFCHRAASLWGRWPGADLANEIAAYANALPAPARVFHVTADPLRCIERMRQRGFAPFVNHPDPAEIVRKMERLQAVAERMEAALARRGVPVIRIPNEGTLAEAETAMQKAAEALARETVTAPPPV